jgi:MFS family permease
VAFVVALPHAAEPSPSRASLNGLDGINFFNAAMLAGFGPYVAVYLAEQKWTQENIGFVLTASGLAGLFALMPGGELLDAVRSKRALAALGASMVAVTALAIGIWPDFPMVFTALVLHGTTGAFLGPAIAAISLGVVGHLALPEQLGRNQRFASAGSLIATGLMGLIGYLLSYQAMFLIAAHLASRCSLHSLRFVQPTLTSRAPAARPIPMRRLSARGPRIDVFGRTRRCLPLPLACFCFNSPTRPCYQ